MALTKLGDEILNHMIVSPRNKAKWDTRRIQVPLQLTQLRSNEGAGIIVQTRKNMRCACYAFDTLRHIGARHSYRRRKIGGAVIQARQYVAMQIDHGLNGSKIKRPPGESPEASRQDIASVLVCSNMHYPAFEFYNLCCI
jgi:hypothetical protein